MLERMEGIFFVSRLSVGHKKTASVLGIGIGLLVFFIFASVLFGVTGGFGDAVSVCDRILEKKVMMNWKTSEKQISGDDNNAGENANDFVETADR